MCLFNRYYWVCSESFLVHSFLWWPQQAPIYEQQWEGLHHILSHATGRTLSSLWAASRFCSKQNTLQLTLTQRDSWFTFQVYSGRQSLPIKAMLKSLPLWAIILNSFAFIWSNNLLVTYTPTFISTKLHVNVREVSGPFVLIFNFVNYSSLSLRVLWPSFSHCLLPALTSHLEIHGFLYVCSAHTKGVGTNHVWNINDTHVSTFTQSPSSP